MDFQPEPDVVGTSDICERTDAPRRTVETWQKLSSFPTARWRPGGRPAWDWWLDLIPWFTETDRLSRVKPKWRKRKR